MEPIVHQSVHKGLPFDPVLSQPSLFRIFTALLCNSSLHIILHWGGWDSIVDIATRYRLKDTEFWPSWALKI